MVDFIEKDGKRYGCDYKNWNGYYWDKCWEVDELDIWTGSNKTFTITPVSKAVDFDENGEPCNWDTIDYIIEEE